MQERVFMGIGYKPFMDIQPSEAAISDRAISCALGGRGVGSTPFLHSTTEKCHFRDIVTHQPKYW